MTDFAMIAVAIANPTANNPMTLSTRDNTLNMGSRLILPRCTACHTHIRGGRQLSQSQSTHTNLVKRGECACSRTSRAYRTCTTSVFPWLRVVLDWQHLMRSHKFSQRGIPPPQSTKLHLVRRCPERCVLCQRAHCPVQVTAGKAGELGEIVNLPF